MRERGAVPPPLKVLFFPLLGLLLLIPFSIASSFGLDDNSAAKIIAILLGMVFLMAAIILPFWYYYKFSAAAEKATNNKISTVVGFVLFLFVSPAAVYIIQDALNSQTAAKA
jgi:amino acid permease